MLKAWKHHNFGVDVPKTNPSWTKESDSDDVVRMRFVHINDVYIMDNLQLGRVGGCVPKMGE